MSDDTQHSCMITIEQARQDYEDLYKIGNLTEKIHLKTWMKYAESRNANKHLPINFDVYCTNMRESFVLEMVKCDSIDCSDLGGKENVIEHLLMLILAGD